MLQNSIKSIAWLIKSGVLMSAGVFLAACTNNMVPYKNPPSYQNQLVLGKDNRWHVIPIDCPILFDQFGHYSPSSNLGCTQTRNLGLMIANPADLLYSTRSGNIILVDRRQPLIYRDQPIAKSAQKYYDDKLPKVQDTYGTSNFIGTGAVGGIP